ncbi:MAG: pimeloyl-ACP methyl ester carboxylesterase [Crocinitomicaceae bacterium]|jgi:pimeloyl-ACP methyl ester carboxylesterase
MNLTGHLSVLNRLIYYELINYNEVDPLVVFFHDALGSVAQWKDFPLQISKKLQLPCLVYDRHGHGLSEPSPLGKRTRKYLENEAELCFKELLKGLKINVPLILVGHSDGATIALVASAEMQSKIIGTISIAGHVFLEDDAVTGIEETVRLYSKNAAGLRDKLAVFHGDKTDALFESWHSIWLSPEYREWNIVESLKNIATPLLVIQGSDDEYATLDHPYIIQANVSGPSEVWIAEKCGHLPHKQLPEEITSKIASFYSMNISPN